MDNNESADKTLPGVNGAAPVVSESFGHAAEPDSGFDPAPPDMLETVEDASLGVYSELAALAPDTLITEDALARTLGKRCRETVKRAVVRGELPQPVKLMGQNVWTVRAIVRHIEERLDDVRKRFGRMGR